MNINAHTFAVYLFFKQQINFVIKFITASETIMILIESYSMNFISLNLQSLCWNIILFNSSSLQPIDLQIIDCIHWISNSQTIIIVAEFLLKKTFNNQVTQLNIKKIFSIFMTELNFFLFKKQEESTQEDIYKEDFTLNDWIIFKRKLVSMLNSKIQNHNLFILKSEELL